VKANECRIDLSFPRHIFMHDVGDNLQERFVCTVDSYSTDRAKSREVLVLYRKRAGGDDRTSTVNLRAFDTAT
jgi:hypothetical protein